MNNERTEECIKVWNLISLIPHRNVGGLFQIIPSLILKSDERALKIVKFDKKRNKEIKSID